MKEEIELLKHVIYMVKRKKEQDFIRYQNIRDYATYAYLFEEYLKNIKLLNNIINFIQDNYKGE